MRKALEKGNQSHPFLAFCRAPAEIINSIRKLGILEVVCDDASEDGCDDRFGLNFNASFLPSLKHR